MSIRLAIVAVVIALMLGGVLALLQRGGSGGAGGGGGASPAPDEELAAFDGGRVVRMSVRRGEGDEVLVERSSAGAWSLRVRGEPAWPVVPENPINLLRGLRTLRGQRAGGDGADGGGAGAIPGDAVVLTLVGDLGETTRFAFDPSPIGGRVRAWANERGPYLVSDALLTALTDPGPIGWRITRVFPGFNEFAAARIAVESGGVGVGLERLGGSWVMRRPVAVDASGDAAAEALRAVLSMPVSRFMPATEALSRRAETEPEWRIEVGGQGGDAAELSVWGPLEPSGALLLGAVTRHEGASGVDRAVSGTGDASAGARSFVAIPSAALRGVWTEPDRYLPRRALERSPGDVASIVIVSGDGDRRAELRRDLSRWMVVGDSQRGDGDRLIGAMPGDRLAGDLLLLLRDAVGEPSLFDAGVVPGRVAVESASAATRLSVPEGVEIAGIVELRGLDGGVLEVVRIGRRRGGEDAGEWAVVALRGPLRWDYAPEVPMPGAIGLVAGGLALPGLEDPVP